MRDLSAAEAEGSSRREGDGRREEKIKDQRGKIGVAGLLLLLLLMMMMMMLTMMMMPKSMTPAAEIEDHA